jgi:hypothetical protein
MKWFIRVWLFVNLKIEIVKFTRFLCLFPISSQKYKRMIKILYFHIQFIAQILLNFPMDNRHFHYTSNVWSPLGSIRKFIKINWILG